VITRSLHGIRGRTPANLNDVSLRHWQGNKVERVESEVNHGPSLKCFDRFNQNKQFQRRG
jgi:hypothetical protein